jgi:hypothetical protein
MSTVFQKMKFRQLEDGPQMRFRIRLHRAFQFIHGDIVITSSDWPPPRGKRSHTNNINMILFVSCRRSESSWPLFPDRPLLRAYRA